MQRILSIHLQGDKPFWERSQCIPLADLDNLREQIVELKRTGVIWESRSPYAAPIMVVKKNNGSLRICIDYCTLSKITNPDQYTTPQIEVALQCLSGAKWLSAVYLWSWCHQIPMYPDDQQKTTLICPVGLFKFNQMQQSLTRAPAKCQCLMEKTVSGMKPTLKCWCT